MTIAVLATARARPGAPDGLLFHMMEMTRRPDAVYLGISAVPSYVVPDGFPRLVVQEFPDVIAPEYGYDKRRALLPLIEEDYVTFMCHDDTYSLDWLEKACKALDEGADVAYCPSNDKPDNAFVGINSGLGNFVVRTALAKQVGFKVEAAGNADAQMIDDLGKITDKIVRIEGVMYYHNIPRFDIPASSWGVEQKAVRHGL